MRKIRSFSLIFADFCGFSLFLGMTAFRRRRFLQKTAGNRRFSQKTAGNRRFSQKPVCPIQFVPFSSALNHLCDAMHFHYDLRSCCGNPLRCILATMQASLRLRCRDVVNLARTDGDFSYAGVSRGGVRHSPEVLCRTKLFRNNIYNSKRKVKRKVRKTP